MEQDFSSLLMFISLNLIEIEHIHVMLHNMSPIEQIVFLPLELEMAIVAGS